MYFSYRRAMHRLLSAIFSLLTFDTFSLFVFINFTLKSAIKSYCFVSPDFMSRPFCSHVALLEYIWGKSGRAFCKQTSVGAACRFQNECHKVETALRVVQFWSEIKLMITNRTPASQSCDFVFTRLISDQIALHTITIIYSPWLR